MVVHLVVVHLAVVHLVVDRWLVGRLVVGHLVVVYLVVAHSGNCSKVLEAFALNSYLGNSWFYHHKCHRFLVDRSIGIVHTGDKYYIHFHTADSCNWDNTGTGATLGKVDCVKAESLWRNSPKLKLYNFFEFCHRNPKTVTNFKLVELRCHQQNNLVPKSILPDKIIIKSLCQLQLGTKDLISNILKLSM